MTLFIRSKAAKLTALLIGALLAISLAVFAHPAHAATFTVIKLKSYNGQCLSLANANVGTQVVTTDCAHAHDWWYYPQLNSGTFRPSGHDTVAVGDSGGFAAIVPSSNNGSFIASDGQEGGPGGLVYNRFYIVPLGANGRLHANGLNSNVSIQAALSNADFWATI